MELNFLCSSSCGRARISPPRGPRSVLCVVVVTTSANGTGFGYSPLAMRPATWAMSTMKYAPTESAIAAKLAPNR